MNNLSTNSWWIWGLRGVIAIAFGILAVMWPNLTLLTLVALFAAYALLGGAVAIVGGVKARKSNENWLFLLLLGVISVGAGVIAVVHPNLTALVLVLLMGANAMVSGVLDLAAGIRMHRSTRGGWLLLLSGVLGIVFGVLVFLYPQAGALAMVWLISLYALVSGAAMFLLAFQLRSRARHGGALETDRRVIPDRRASGTHSHA